MLNNSGAGGGARREEAGKTFMYKYIYMYTFFSDAVTSGDLLALVASGWYSVYKIVGQGLFQLINLPFQRGGKEKSAPSKVQM